MGPGGPGGSGTAGAPSAAAAKAIAENAGKIAANAQQVSANAARGTALEKALKAEVVRLESAAQALAGRLAALERLVAAGASGATGAAGRGREASLVAAIGQLREAVRGGRSFVDELEAVRALAGTPPARAMAVLRGAAATGVPLERALRARFPAAAVAILRAAGTPAKASWVDRAIARARSVVVVRRTGPGVTGTSPEAIVARAEAQLASGDLKAAVATLGGLKGPAAAAARPWRQAARIHLTVLEAVATLHRAALARIGAAKPPIEGGAGTGKPKSGTPKSGAGKSGAGDE
jgi:hypothetical protein